MKLFLILIGFPVQTAFARSPYFGIYCSALGTYCGDGAAYIAHVAYRVADTLVIPLVGGIGVIAVLWASIKMISSFGNEQGKEDAKKIITFAVIGIALAVAGVVITKWVCELVQLATNGSGLCS